MNSDKLAPVSTITEAQKDLDSLSPIEKIRAGYRGEKKEVLKKLPLKKTYPYKGLRSLPLFISKGAYKKLETLSLLALEKSPKIAGAKIMEKAIHRLYAEAQKDISASTKKRKELMGE